MCPNTPWQNAIVERKNCHFFEVTHALLFEKSVPKSYLGEAVLIVAYLFIWLLLREREKEEKP